MALPLAGFDLICLAVPSESLFGELYLISLTCGMVFLKARVLAHLPLQFMQAHFLMSPKSTSQLSIFYADNSQLYISFSPKAHSGLAEAVASIEHCIQDISMQWMSQDKLLVNDAKTELLLIGTRQQLAKITTDGIIVGHSVIAPQPPVRNLGVWF